MRAYEIQPGDEVTIPGTGKVVVSQVTRRDGPWIANGVIRFIATNGIKYGLDRYDYV